jgi:hypothetical protein
MGADSDVPFGYRDYVDDGDWHASSDVSEEEHDTQPESRTGRTCQGSVARRNSRKNADLRETQSARQSDFGWMHGNHGNDESVPGWPDRCCTENAGTEMKSLR